MDADGPTDQAGDGWWGDLASVTPDLLVVVRIDDGTVLAANTAWKHRLGLDPTSLIGQDQRDLVHPDDRLVAYGTLAALGPGECGEFTHRIAHADGSWRWVWWSCRVSADGALAHAAGRDITEHRAAFDHALERRDRLSDAERIGRLGSFSWLPEDEYADFSRELRRLAGLEELDSAVPVATFFAVVDPTDLPRLKAALREVVDTGVSFDIEYDLLPRGGPRRRVTGHAEMVRGGDGRRRLVGTVRDVTDQRRMETGLRRALQTQQAAVAELERLDRVKSAFLRAVSHELRTPVTVVRGMADTLLRLRDSAPPETIRRLETALVDNAERLAELLEDLLDVDRMGVDRGGVGRGTFDAAEMLRQLAASRPHPVTYRGDDHLLVHVDEVELERIVTNLLDNALKYAQGTDVEVVASALPGRGLRLEVIDQGPGVPADERERVFEPFHRLDDRHASPGTGVGLALVAAFAEAHDGRAWIAPSDVGTHVIVELPDEVTRRG